MATLLLLTACTAAPGSTPSPAQRLDGRAFLSTAVTESGKPQDLAPGTRIRMSFSTSNLAVQAGCNTMSGAFRLDDVRLVVESMSATEMGCDRPRMDQDAWLSAFLASSPTLLLTGNELTLASSGTTIVLLDRRIGDSDRPLAGTVWRVESLTTGQAAHGLPSDTPARLTFGSDGRVAIETGCNAGAAAYVVDGGSLRFTGIGLTKKACPGPRAELEAAIVAVLGADRVAFAIEGSSLQLSAGERGLGLRAK